MIVPQNPMMNTSYPAYRMMTAPAWQQTARRRLAGWLLMCALFLAAARPVTSEEPISLSKPLYEGLPAIRMENAFIRVTVVPARGGRILEYALKATGHNVLAKGEGDWDGWTDILDVEWPGPEIRQRTYQCASRVDPNMGSITCTLPYEEVRLERTVKMRPSSSAIEVEVRLTNTGKEPRDLLYGTHLCAKIGEFLETGRDWLLWTEGPDRPFQRQPAAVTWEQPSSLSTRPEWMTLMDQVTEELFIIRFLPEDGARFIIWKGIKSTNPQCYWRFPNVPPGESRTVRVFMALCQGLTDVQAVSERGAIQAETPRDVYGQDENVPLKARFCPFESASSLRFAAALRPEKGVAGDVVTRTFEGATPVKPLVFTNALPTGQILDGKAELALRVEGKTGKEILSFRKPLMVDGTRLLPLRQELQGVIQALSKSRETRPVQEKGRFAQAVAFYRARWLLEDVQQAYESGAFEKTVRLLADIRRLLGNHQSALSKEDK